MKLDVFFSICQTEVDGYLPNERQMFLNFFDQLRLADELGFGTGWVAETHLSCQTQKLNPGAVIPHFKGEIGLNTDILQLAHLGFAKTKRINMGSAIRNILCNGGPIAHAEAVRTFLSLHGLSQERKLELGFAAGRFHFSNTAYGIKPRDTFEESLWDHLKNRVFAQATEMFLRLLKGERISSADVKPLSLEKAAVKELKVAPGVTVIGETHQAWTFKSFYEFDKVGVIPFESPLNLLNLTIGSHDPEVQILANEFLPVGVFNLSITPSQIIEETHQRMREHYNSAGGAWTRDKMPRTVLVFLDQDSKKAKLSAEKGWRNYWTAMEKTLDPKKVEQAVSNAIFGTPKEVAAQILEKYHKEDRLMLWFDFNNHDNENIKGQMRLFMDQVAPELG